MVKKKPKFGALPTLNMPKKSIETTKAVATRTTRSIVRNDLPTNQNTKRYKNFPELCKRVETLKCTKEWTVQELHDRIVLKKGSTMILSELLLLRYMWNGDKYILWQHIAQLYYQDAENGLKLLPRITFDHIKLNSYSVMRVNLAAQVLSATVAAVLESFGPAEASATAKFCSMVDSFFDCLNVRSKTEHQRKRKPFLAPYTSVNDPKFAWLETTFLGYLREWKQSIANCPGNFSKNAKSRMFISWQTFEGFQITVNSAVEATKFLLNEGMEYVLTERFCQDPVEEYFGNQRKLGRRSDNPDIKTFGYNSNTIWVQRAVSCQSGNTRGRKDRSKAWVNVSNDPVPKKKKK